MGMVALSPVVSSYLLIYFTDSVGTLMVGAFIGGSSLSLIFTYLLIAIARKVDASTMAARWPLSSWITEDVSPVRSFCTAATQQGQASSLMNGAAVWKIVCVF